MTIFTRVATANYQNNTYDNKNFIIKTHDSESWSQEEVAPI